MDSLPEDPSTPTAHVEEAFPQPPLPAGLLDSSPELGNAGQKADNTCTLDGQPVTAVEQTVLVQPAVTTPPTNVAQQPRHHDLIMDRNDEFEDELWTAMSRKYAASHVEGTQESCTLQRQVPGTRPAEPRVTFQPPRNSRTPAQRVAAEQLENLVTARARQREPAWRTRHTQFPTPGHGTAAESDGSHIQTPTPAGNGAHNWHQGQIQGQNPPTFSDGVSGLGGQSPMYIQTPFMGLQTPLQLFQTAQSQVPLNVSEAQQDGNEGLPPRLIEKNGHTAQNHLGDSVFNQMMNDLIVNGRAENVQHHQVQLPSGRPIPFGMEFLYYGELIGPPHHLYSRARRQWSVMREIRSARNSEIVGWHDSESYRPGGIHLCPAHSPGRWDLRSSQPEEPSSGQSRRRQGQSAEEPI